MSEIASPTVIERCPLCGTPLDQNPDECSKCDWVRGYRQRKPLEWTERDKVAAILSVVPGAGHIFKGYKLAGFAIMFVGLPIVCVFAFAVTMYFGWLLVPTYWIVVAGDAYFRKDLTDPRDKPAAAAPLKAVPEK